MKRLCAEAVIISLLFLNACSSNTIYSNYKQIENLLVVQTIGIDLDNSGKICLSLATGNIGNASPIKLFSIADSISSAQELLNNYTPGKELNYSHVKYIIIGRSLASAGLQGISDYILRSADIRADIPVFISVNESASRLVLNGGTDTSSITESLDSLMQIMATDSNVYSIIDIARASSIYGPALAVCINCTKQSGAQLNESGLSVRFAGYAVLNHLKLEGLLPFPDSRGVELITENIKPYTIDLCPGNYHACVVLDDVKTQITPIFSLSGDISKIDITLVLEASLKELVNSNIVDENTLSILNKNLSSLILEWLNNSISLSKETQIDFLGLENMVMGHSSKNYSKASTSFSSQLKNIDFDIDVIADIGRSYDLSLTAATGGLP